MKFRDPNTGLGPPTGKVISALILRTVQLYIMHLFEINSNCVIAVRMQNIQYLELVNVRASYEDKRFVHIRSGPKPTLRENKSVSDVINFTLMIKIFRLRLVSEEFSLKPDLII